MEGHGTRPLKTRCLRAALVLAALATTGAATDGFLATCEDQARFCFADACGRDQIEASLLCRDRCPSAAIMSVVPAACPIPRIPPEVVLRRRG